MTANRKGLGIQGRGGLVKEETLLSLGNDFKEVGPIVRLKIRSLQAIFLAKPRVTQPSKQERFEAGSSVLQVQTR